MPNTPKEEPASIASISLSEAILAPLNSIFKAQIHAARSFLNFLFQMAYPHVPVDEQGNVDLTKVDESKRKPYTMDIPYSHDGTTIGTLKIPSLALLPIMPIGVDEADFHFSLVVESIGSHTQMQASEESVLKKEDAEYQQKRPWFLVEDPKSIRGTFKADANTAGELKSSNAIEVTIKVKRMPTPAALEKALSLLTQTIQT